MSCNYASSPIVAVELTFQAIPWRILCGIRRQAIEEVAKLAMDERFGHLGRHAGVAHEMANWHSYKQISWFMIDIFCRAFFHECCWSVMHLFGQKWSKFIERWQTLSGWGSFGVFLLTSSNIFRLCHSVPKRGLFYWRARCFRGSVLFEACQRFQRSAAQITRAVANSPSFTSLV